MRVFLLLAFFTFSLASICQAPRDRSVVLSVSQVGLRDTFGFEILYHNQMVGGSVFIRYNHTSESRGPFAKGDTIRIRAGRTSRPCSIQPFYVIPETGNLRITLDCGTPAPPPAPRDRSVILTVSQVGLRDTFGFEVLYHGSMVGGSVFIRYNHNSESRGPFAKGDTIRIRPGRTTRPCNIQPLYVIPETGNLNITLDCGTPAPPPAPRDLSVILSVSQVGSRDTFGFEVLYHGQMVGNSVFIDSRHTSETRGPFAKGDTIRIRAGRVSRPCSIQPFYVIPETGNLSIALNCNAAPAGDTSRHRVGLRVSPLSSSDSLLIALSNHGDEPFIMIIKQSTGIQYFPIRYKIGDTLLLWQWDWSTKTCSFEGANSANMLRIIMGDSDRIVNCNCGQTSVGFNVGIRVNAPPTGQRVQFQARVKGQQVSALEIVGPASLAYFPFHFTPGDTVTIYGETDRQMWCVPKGNVYSKYIIPNDTLIINASCGMLPYIRMGAMNPYETFSFEITNKYYPKDTVYIKSLAGPLAGSRTPFMKNRYYEGDTVWVRQISGPRVCSLPSYAVIFNGFNYIDANCPESGNHDSTGGPPQKTRIAGTYSAPPGTRITIQNNGSNDITLTSPSYNANGNNSIGFSFPQTYDGGTAYTVSIKSQPTNCKCAIQPAASGTTPIDSLQLNIICSPGVELVSRGTDNKGFNTFYETVNPVVGGKGNDEGRFVAFLSSGTGLDGATGKHRQIFWRDMRSGVTKLISRSQNGEEANGDNFAPAISADGRSVAFESYASNLSSGDNNGFRDIYVWKDGTGVSLISKGGNAESFEPTISGDGSVIAFSSSASNLTAGVEGNSTVNVYVASSMGSIQLITKDFKTQKGVGGSAPSISEDGNKVVFSSSAYTLVENDNNNLWDIFLWQRGAQALKKISLTSSGGDRDQGTESASRVVSASISGNGNYIVYSTTASNMVSSDNNKLQDIFICNISGSGVRRLSVTANNTEGDGDSPIEQGGRIGISYDGNWISYNTNATNLGVAKGNIILQNTRTGKIIAVTNSIYNTTGRPMVSRTGAFVVAGCSEKLDTRFVSSGIFEFFTGPQLSGN